MKKHICIWFPLLLFAMILAACGGQPTAENAQESTDAPAAESINTTEPTAVPAVEPAQIASGNSAALAKPELVGIPAPSPPSVEVIEVTDECRVIRHALGETCVPLDVQKIVSMDPGTVTDNLLALNRKPIGSIVYAPLEQGVSAAFPPAIAELAEGIESVGTEPGNIEKIVELQPDLIIGFTWIFEETYAEFSQIAPTVALEDTNDWRTKLIDTAHILGEDEAAEQIINQFYADAAALDETLTDITISLLRPRTETLQIYGTGAEVARILNAMGISLTFVPESAFDLWEGDDEAGQVSYEILPEIEGDAFFVISYNLTSEEMTELQESALWQSHPVVQDDMTFNVEGTAWTNHGPNGVYRVMEEVEAALSE